MLLRSNGSMPLTMLTCFVAPFLALGCGVTYKGGLHSVAASEQSGGDGTLPSQAGFKATALVHEIALRDSSGVLLAFLGTASSAMVARQRAIDEMLRTGASSAEYTFNVTPIVPGPETKLYYRFGSAEGFDYTLGGATSRFDDGSFNVSGFGVGVNLWQWHPRERVYVDLAIAAEFMSYTVKGSSANPTPLNEPTEAEPFYIPADVTVSYLLSPRWKVAGTLGYDPLQSLLDLLLGGGQLWSAALHSELALTTWLTIEGGVNLHAYSDGIGDFQRDVNDAALWAGVRLDRR